MKPLLYIFAATLPLWAQSPTINPLPTREFGQPQLRTPQTSTAPNLVEGRELTNPYAIAFDRSTNPPIIYIADTSNNRVLAWKNSTGLGQGNFADLVIGQPDMQSTLGQGPSQSGSTLPTGLAIPTGVAVDSSGNLYVADANNNRILRYPSPFHQTLTPLQADLVIGQASFNAGSSPNQGKGVASATSLFLSVATSGGVVQRTGLALDSAGNLWVTDVGNNRVLRFPASSLTPNTNLPTADLVLGQFDFVSNSTPTGANVAQTNKLNTVGPLDLTFDQTGNLYVADSYSRVLFFSPPFANGVSAVRVLGISQTPPPGQNLTLPNQYSLGVLGSNNALIPPECVFTVGNNLFVCDTGANRVVYYDVPANWPAETATQHSPPLIGTTIGQGSSFTTATVNRGLPVPNGIGIDGNALALPFGGGFNGTDLWIADTGNNRILGFPQQGSLNFPAPTRLLGQVDFQYNSPNLVEGREVHFFPSNEVVVGAGLVVDKNSTPPHLYVADSQNNRILGFRDANNVVPGQTADIVIGQANLFSALPNYPNNGSSVGQHPVNPTATGLYNPTGLAVDANGNLLVADTGNGRVLRFPAPFSQSSGSLQTANLVLGQTSFTQYDPTARSQTMAGAYGLALFADGSVAVSDVAQNRVLIFQRPGGGDFSNGQAAAHVLGQADFSAVSSGSALGSLNGPRHISTDTSDRLYVADSGNNRVVVYNNARNTANGAAAAFVLNPGFNQPFGVVVSPLSGEIWVSDTNNNQIYRFPEFQTLVLNPTQITAKLGSPAPIALTLDGFDNLIVGEATNRVTFYYGQIIFRHEGNFNRQSLVPGMLANVGRLGLTFNFPVAPNPNVLPFPTILNDVQLIMVGGDNCPNPTTAVPLFGIDSGGVIHFQVPQCANTSGTQSFLVKRPSTGQIVAVGTFQMGQYNPGFFATNQQGTGQVAARNNDHVTANGPGAPVGRGQELDLYLTGSGFVPCNGLPDGQVIPSGTVCPTPLRPKITMVPGPPSFLPDSAILYSGLGGFVGGWQINMVVPQEVIPSNNVLIVVTMEGVPSNIGGRNNSDGTPGVDAGTQGIPPIQTFVAVK